MAKGHKKTPYKHANAAYGTTMTRIPSKFAYGGCKKICHAIPPRWKNDPPQLNNTGQVHYIQVIVIQRNQ